jgi:hypothetical protein
MRVTTVIRAMALAALLLAGVSVAGVKYVAVVETDVDASSGASADLNPAEVREITAELRRQAAKNLPSGRYSVMTSETVQSMGGAVLEECADENCVITLGSKIGAGVFNIVRSITYHKPNPNSTVTSANFNPYDGLKLTILPTESGDYKVYARYDYSF